MREVLGKRVLETDEEVFAPRHTALLVVDVQNDFGHPEGYWAVRGHPVAAVAALVPGIERLVERARAAGALVAWVLQTTLPEGRSDSPAWLAFKLRNGHDGQYTIEGSWGQEPIAPLAPAAGEPVVRKLRSSGFVHTELDRVLRANGIESVVVCGCMTEGCVESTVRSAAFEDYYTGVVGDLVASNSADLHEASLRVMASQFRVRPAARFHELWEAAA